LSAGSYTCTITDANGCFITKIFTITQPTAITATSTMNVATCGNPNGSASVTPSGGTPGYTYSWAPIGGNAATATGLPAASYTCTITDANGCTFQKVVVVTNAGSPTATLSASTNVSCNGGSNGSATVIAAGGTGPYTYAWTPTGGTAATATGLSAQTYTCTVTDANGCTSIATVTITEPPVLTATSSQVNPLCNGGTGTGTVVAAGGTSPYTYAWTPSGGNAATSTAITAGNYTCTITDAHGCTTTQAFTIVAPTAVASTQSQVNVLCNGGTGTGTVVASGGTGPYTYAWTPSGGTAATSTPITAGNYSCTITDANGCTLVMSFTITQPTPVTATSTFVQSTCGNSNGSATATPAGGVGPYTFSWAPSGGTAATATGLLAGAYTCTVTDANGCTTTTSVTVLNAGSPTASISASTNVSCNGGSNGSATGTATGGTGPYTYAWTPTGGNAAIATGLNANTYTCTVTDANGCTSIATVTITEPPVLTATSSQVNPLCNGGTGTGTVVAAGGTSPYTYAWTPSGGNAATSTAITAGNYTCTITDALGCTTTQSFTIVAPTAVAATQSQINVLCNGGTGTGTVVASGGTGIYTYAWTPTGGNAATSTPIVAGNYSCTITDANGCTLVVPFTITEPTALTATTTFVQSTCGNANGSATVIPAGGTGLCIYSWTPVGGTNATATGLLAGPYTVTVTDANGCTTTATVNVPNAGSPTLTLSSSTNVSCNGGNNATAIVTAAGGTGPYTYNWLPTGGTAATANGLTANTYTCTVTDANGCTATASVTITEPPVLTLTTSQADELCFGGNTSTANVIPTGGTAPYTYVWSNGPTTATITALTAGGYTVTVTDAHGCTATANVTILQPTALALTTSQVNVTCFGGNNGSANVVATGGTGLDTYSWTPSSQTTATANGLTATSYTVNVTDVNGCFTSASLTITQPTAVVVTTTDIDAHCNLSDGSAIANATGGNGPYTYAWLPAGTGDTISAIPAGTYTVTATDVNGCTGTNTVTVHNLNGVTASIISSTQVLCHGQGTGEIVVGGTGGVGPYNYSWLPNVTVADSATGLPAGNYQITVIDSSGCTSTVSVTLTQPPLLTVTASASPAAVCSGSQVTLTSTPVGGNPAYTVTWQPGNLSGNSQTLTPLASGNDTVFVVDANGCTANAVVPVTVFPMPTASFTSDVITGCAPVCVNFTDASTIGNPGVISAWDWNFGDNTTSNLQNPTHCYNTAGIYTVTLQVKSADGCTNTITMTNYITIFANPIAAFGDAPQPTTILNPQIFFSDSSSNAVSWSWNFGDLSNSSSTLENPNFTYPPTVDCYNVLLTVTSINGCTDSVSHPVCLKPDVAIYVPNAFTPNGDGKNEVFMPVGVGLDPDHFEMWIFDRWGNLIFYTDDLNKGWDGKVQGGSEVAQIDTYVYKVKAKDLDGIEHDLEGKVSLIK